jgi:hypothetical protein
MPTTHKIALIAPEEGLTPLSLVASDVNKKLESVILGTGLDFDSGGILSILASEINHDLLLNVHQDVNTDASPQFAKVGIGTTTPDTELDVIGSGWFKKDVDWNGIFVGESISKYASFSWRNTLERVELYTVGYDYPFYINGSLWISTDTNSGNIGIKTTAPGALLDIGLAGTTLGVIRLAGSTSGNVSLQPNVIAGTDIILTLPATTGTLVTGGGTASGSNTGDITISDTSSVDLALTGQQISATVLPAGVDHNSLNNYATDNHIAHSGVSITAGTGMSGGGTIAETRTLACTITQYTDALARTACIASSISDGDLTHSPDGNSVFDALALKAPLISPSFTTPTLGAALATSISIDGHVLDSNEWHYLDGQDQTVLTTSQPTFAGIVTTQVTSLPGTVVQNKLILLNNATKTALYFGKWSTTSTATSGMVAQYKMNDNAADHVIADSSGNALHGVSIAHTDTMTVAGKINTALEFDGAVDYGRVANNALLNFGTGDFATSFWMKTTTAGTMRLLTKSTESVVGWELYIGADLNYLSGYMGDSGGYTYTGFSSYTGNLRDGNWHHIVVNYDRDGNATPYIDGVAYTGVSISTRTGSINNTDDLGIGIYINFSVSKFTGSLDDIRLYNRLLTVQEIANLYNAGNGTEGGEQPYWAELAVV